MDANLVFFSAAALFLVTFSLGLLVQFRIVDTKPFRWVHHALFFAVFAAAVLAAGVGFLTGAPFRWPLLAVIALFCVLPFVRAGTLGHAGIACAALVLYAVGLAQTV